jgi:hypothetical protein
MRSQVAADCLRMEYVVLRYSVRQPGMRYRLRLNAAIATLSLPANRSSGASWLLRCETKAVEDELIRLAEAIG